MTAVRDPMRVAVLGAGGVGGLMGVLLAHTGDEVTILGAGAGAETLRERGVELHSLRFGDVHASVGVAAELDGPVDVCIVAVKSRDLDAALGRIPSAAVGRALVVPFLNGFEHVAVLRERYPDCRVVAATIRVESYRTAPGVIEQRSPFAAVEMATRPEVDADLRRLGDHLVAAGFDVAIREGEAAVLWDKLVFLGPMALLTTHAEAPVGVVRTELRDDLVAVVHEFARVARAEGARIDPEATIAAIDAVPETMRSSMQKDAAAGRPIELDAIGGAVLRAAARTGIEAPVTGRLVRELGARVAV